MEQIKLNTISARQTEYNGFNTQFAPQFCDTDMP